MLNQGLLRRAGMGDAAGYWNNWFNQALASTNTPNPIYNLGPSSNPSNAPLAWQIVAGQSYYGPPVASGAGAMGFLGQYGTYLLIGGGVLIVFALLASKK